MTIEQKRILNDFFVDTFNKIMAYEERHLTRGKFANVSVKEFHAIEAVAKMTQSNENTMSGIAGQLALSVGSLTTTMNVLVKKGYVQRRGSQKDRRIIYIELTEAGLSALECHRKFHVEMVESVDTILRDEEVATLTTSLEKLSAFFYEKFKNTDD